VGIERVTALLRNGRGLFEALRARGHEPGICMHHLNSVDV
jgi:hypothetical protein